MSEEEQRKKPNSGQILLLFLTLSHQRMRSKNRVGSGGMVSAPPLVSGDGQETIIVHIAPNHHDTLFSHLLLLLQGWQPHSMKRHVDASVTQFLSHYTVPGSSCRPFAVQAVGSWLVPTTGQLRWQLILWLAFIETTNEECTPCIVLYPYLPFCVAC